ncbi:MAG: hypothetical protein DI538_15100 [Azospira oryzae]|nr:MAG: hypothetical protein DI538_15100 [Azospira oryzae]
MQENHTLLGDLYRGINKKNIDLTFLEYKLSYWKNNFHKVKAIDTKFEGAHKPEICNHITKCCSLVIKLFQVQIRNEYTFMEKSANF